MKKILGLILVCMAAIHNFSIAQSGTGRSGSFAPYVSTTMHTCTPAGTAKSTGKDTLSNGDTGVLYIFIGQGFATNFELNTTTVSGTVATTSNILYGYNNYGIPLTASQAATIAVTPTNAYALTGSTTVCAGCVGASSTTVPGAAKRYTWQIPYNGGAVFDNYIIRTIQTGTCTATYTGKVTTIY
jgi:hypothetical protein